MKRISKQKILILVILDVLLVATVLLVRFFQSEREERMYSQQAGARWESEDVECAQVSAFFAGTKQMKVDNITSIHNDIMKKLYDYRSNILPLEVHNLEHNEKMIIQSFIVE